jgi:transcriptional regulator with XRE-family HTH domain
MSITDKIREIRSLKSISQEYMACQLGIDTSSYHRLERGTSPLSIGRLERIALILNVQIVELLSQEAVIHANVNDQSNYISHLEDEIKFLRNQLQEKLNLTMSARESDAESAYQARQR